MQKNHRLIVPTFALVLLPVLVGAQSRDPIAGVWELTSSKNLTSGAKPQPNPIAPALRAIYLDGYFVQFTAAEGRAKLQKPTSDMTKEELLARYRLQGQSGTYSVKGNTIVRKILVAAAPENEGVESMNEFRIEGDTLVVMRSNAQKEKIEDRYRRLKPTS